MNKLLLITLIFLAGCGSSPQFIPVVPNPQVVIQPQPVPIPNIGYNIGEIVFVRSGYGVVCRGRIVNILNPYAYVLNPVICNYNYYFNVVVHVNQIFR